ncbi:hypothetical protein GCM10010844_42870 [Deinococcus radiotolerans]|uniref:Uncharacterized protein n=1 Tax=Deinococcus radiotolerans TaxID=1309407 RepID=A0ABQ2FRJ5_9DEIO|nr:hypothetical protein GCM10010844_42870 [Deinococcus radiotolerans]
MLQTLVSSCGTMGLLNLSVAASRGAHLAVLHVTERRKFAKGCARTPAFVRVDRDWEALPAQAPGEA